MTDNMAFWNKVSHHPKDALRQIAGHCVEKTTRAMSKLLVAVMLLAFQTAGADTLSGRVVGIADGDTLTVLDGKNHQHKIRLSGIDAPEKSRSASDWRFRLGRVARNTGTPSVVR